eukprot:8443400-Pyramimonas_sp.AAC.1
MLSQKLEPLLDNGQAKDQAGFRRGFSTLDYVWVSSILQETGWEWNRSLWFAALDSKKAFDSVEHSNLDCIEKTRGSGRPHPFSIVHVQRTIRLSTN